MNWKETATNEWEAQHGLYRAEIGKVHRRYHVMLTHPANPMGRGNILDTMAEAKAWAEGYILLHEQRMKGVVS